MRAFNAVIQDLVDGLPEILALHYGASEPTEIRDRIEEELGDVDDVRELSRWLVNSIGAFGISNILRNIGIPFEKNASPQELVDVWLEHRKLTATTLNARPQELAETIRELASQVKVASEKFAAPDLLLPFFLQLMRYLTFFYWQQLPKPDNAEGASNAIETANIIEHLDFRDFFHIITRSDTLRCRPYHPNCNEHVHLCCDKVKEALELLEDSSFSPEQATGGREISDILLELLSYWQKDQQNSVVPKGAVVSESFETAFKCQATCYDEFNERLIVRGMESTMSVGDNLLLATGEQGKIWAPGLQALPNKEAWKTPSLPEYQASAPTRERALRRKREKVFICYDKKDSKWLERVQVYLKLLKIDKRINLWSDAQITAGTDGEIAIHEALQAAKVAILLISPDFLVSSLIREEQLPYLLRASQDDDVQIIPLFVRRCAYDQSELKEIKPFNDADENLTALSEDSQDKILVQLAQKVASYFE